MDFFISDKAEELGIELHCLPSNTTHELQPLDKSCFRSVEANWDAQIDVFWDSITGDGDRTMNKLRFQHVFSKTWDLAMTAKNIKAGKLKNISPF